MDATFLTASTWVSTHPETIFPAPIQLCVLLRCGGDFVVLSKRKQNNRVHALEAFGAIASMRTLNNVCALLPRPYNDSEVIIAKADAEGGAVRATHCYRLLGGEMV